MGNKPIGHQIADLLDELGDDTRMTPSQDSACDVKRLRVAIDAGLRSFCSDEGDFTMSAAMRRSAADHILGQPDFFAALAVPINKIGEDAK